MRHHSRNSSLGRRAILWRQGLLACYANRSKSSIDVKHNIKPRLKPNQGLKMAGSEAEASMVKMALRSQNLCRSRLPLEPWWLLNEVKPDITSCMFLPYHGLPIPRVTAPMFRATAILDAILFGYAVAYTALSLARSLSHHVLPSSCGNHEALLMVVIKTGCRRTVGA